MRSTACPGDDDFDAALFCFRRIGEEQIGSAMCLDHSSFVRNAQSIQGLRGVSHRFPIRGRAHDDADERVFSFRIEFRGHAEVLGKWARRGRPGDGQVYRAL